MQKLLGTFILIVSAIVHAQTNAPKVTVTRWPQDRVAAISLTFDDGLNSHLDVVGPILKKYHLKGTFFVNTGRLEWKTRKSEWHELVAQGNELGNHTVNHPCLLEEIEPHSQNYTPEMMEAEVRDAATEITAITRAQRGLTFAYPCGNESFGPPSEQVQNSALYMRYVAEHAFGARGSGSGGSQDPDELNVLNIVDLGPTAGKDFMELLAMADVSLRGHQWGVYCFHGVGGEYLSVNSSALGELAAYLQGHTEIWTATFGDVVRYIQERKSAVIEIREKGKGSIDVVLSWPLDSHIYDLPLTLKVEVTERETRVAAMADGISLQPKLIKQNDRATLLVDIPPNTSVVHIMNAGR